MESNQKLSTTPTRGKLPENNIVHLTKSPPRTSPVVSTGSSTSVTSPSENSADHKGDKLVSMCKLRKSCCKLNNDYNGLNECLSDYAYSACPKDKSIQKKD